MRILGITASSLDLGAAEAEEPSFTERIARGDPAAIAAVYDQHHPALCAFARRLLPDEAAAEDLVQDVFVSLPRVIGRLSEGRSLRHFLLGVTANRARHHYRSFRRFTRMTERLAREPEQPTEPPDRRTERGALARILGRALDRLSLAHRVTFVLCDVEGRSAKDAAEILCVPEATVRTRLFAARKKLRAALSREGYP